LTLSSPATWRIHSTAWQSGGYKISALEIERVFMEHERVAECAVVGISDEEWGERVAILLKLV
jgi:malonyl-CoA/methylmalonyl-CoA synthetase